MCACVYVCVHVFVYVYVCMCVCTYVYACACVCDVYVHVCVCVSTCMCVYGKLSNATVPWYICSIALHMVAVNIIANLSLQIMAGLGHWKVYIRLHVAAE